MTELAPIWKTPTRAQAVAMLRACRSVTDELLAPLSNKQRTTPTTLGDGTWTVKDLLGHLSMWEERALDIIDGKPAPPFASADEMNAHGLERTRGMTLPKVEREYARVRGALVDAIETMDDERWLAKVETGSGRTALALRLGKLLVGGRHGYFAHDLAHRNDLTKAVQHLTAV
ncbi:MAG TPA: maleylpyruvate isomerase family mycothiol-dependent enzyme [Acidimicrobiales bacterium]|nr:maleylpyruvate isomerase family mycothiol-dependent enzyme [Acidimicrobiales bacterium]